MANRTLERQEAWEWAARAERYRAEAAAREVARSALKGWYRRVIDGDRVDRFRPRRALRLSINIARDIQRLLRMWRLLVIREPPSDSDGERQRWINGQRVAPQYLWEVGCRVYQTAVIDCVRAWRMEAGWRADWRGVPDLAGWGDSWACTPRGGHVCSEGCFRQHDVKCEERPPVDGGRNPE